MHMGITCSLLIRHGRCAHCHQCRKAVCLLSSSLHLQGWEENLGWTYQLLNLVISGNCFTKSSLYSEEKLGVGLGIPINLSVKVCVFIFAL